jgi:hypothetical protein
MVEFFINYDIEEGNFYQIEIRVDVDKNIFTIQPIGVQLFMQNLTIVRELPKWSISKMSLKTLRNNFYYQLELNFTIKIDLAFPVENLTNKSLTWINKIFVSKQQYFDEKKSFKLLEQIESYELKQKEEKVFQVGNNYTIQLDDSIFGQYFVHLLIDEENFIKKIANYPTPLSKTLAIEKIANVLEITLIQTETSESRLIQNLTFVFKNTGLKFIPSINLDFYLRNAYSSGAIFLNNFHTNSANLLSNETLTKSFGFDLSKTLFSSGTYYLTIQKNQLNQINSFEIQSNFKYSFYANLKEESRAFAIFNITQLTFSIVNQNNIECDNKYAELQVDYTTENTGNYLNNALTWTDQLTIKCDNQILSSKTISTTKLFNVFNTKTYSNSALFILNKMTFELNRCAVRLETNSNNNLYILKVSSSVHSKDACCFDVAKKETPTILIQFQADHLLSTNLLVSGESGSVIYRLKNIGKMSQYDSYSSWRDGVYLHKQEQDSLANIKSTGSFLGSKILTNVVVKCNETSQQFAISYQIPSSLKGDLYLYLIHDIDNTANHGILNSNKKVHIKEASKSDLVIRNFILNNNVSKQSYEPGESIQINFDILNIGENRAESSLNWFDTIYFARFSSAAQTDFKLSTSASIKNLNINESYAKQVEVKVPMEIANGDYYLIIVTDSSNRLLETNKDNNEVYKPIRILSSFKFDLSVTNVSLNISLNYFNFKWTMNSDKIMKAEKCDRFFLSEKKEWSLTRSYELDELTSSSCSKFETKDKQLSLSYANRAQVPLLKEGVYFGLVRTISNLKEENLDNNVDYSEQPINVTIESIEFNKEKLVNITPNAKIAFKIETNLDSKDIEVLLRTDSNKAYHDMYLSKDKIPSEFNYLTKSSFFNSFNQTIRLKSGVKSTYYLLVKSFKSISNSEPYNIRLYMRDLNEIMVDSLNNNLICLNRKSTLRLLGNYPFSIRSYSVTHLNVSLLFFLLLINSYILIKGLLN